MSLLDILASKRNTYDQEVEARKNAVTQRAHSKGSLKAGSS